MMPHYNPEHLKEVVFTLRQTYGLNYEETAAVMGVSPSWFYKMMQENRPVSFTNAVMIKHRIIRFMRERKEDTR